MEIIAFGDMHMATGPLAGIAGLSRADCVIVTGDITNFGGRSEAKMVLNDILAYNRNLLCLAGNLDRREVNDYLEDLGMNLHGQAHMIKHQACVYGVGGGNAAFPQTAWVMEEEELYRTVHEAHRQAEELLALAEPIAGHRIPTIFACHVPPHGTTVDRLRSGKHLGSQVIRQHIEYHRPDICVTGHIHEAKGVDVLGRTAIVNTGLLTDGGWATITIDKSSLTYTLQ